MSPMPTYSHVSALPTGYRFAMASVIDDAKKKGQDATYFPQRSHEGRRYLEFDSRVNCLVDFALILTLYANS